MRACYSYRVEIQEAGSKSWYSASLESSLAAARRFVKLYHKGKKHRIRKVKVACTTCNNFG